MEKKVINELKDKFFKGITSGEEEGILKEYYSGQPESEDPFLVNYCNYLKVYEQKKQIVRKPLFRQNLPLKNKFRSRSEIAAAGLILIVTGFLLGLFFYRLSGLSANNEITGLRNDIHLLRKELILQQFEEPFASDRIKAIQQAKSDFRQDEQVIHALGNILVSDNNANVRLEAAYTLYDLGHNEMAVKELAGALNNQSQEVFVQVLLIQMLMSLQEQSASSNIESAIRDNRIPPDDQRWLLSKYKKWYEKI